MEFKNALAFWKSKEAGNKPRKNSGNKPRKISVRRLTRAPSVNTPSVNTPSVNKPSVRTPTRAPSRAPSVRKNTRAPSVKAPSVNLTREPSVNLTRAPSVRAYTKKQNIHRFRGIPSTANSKNVNYCPNAPLVKNKNTFDYTTCTCIKPLGDDKFNYELCEWKNLPRIAGNLKGKSQFKDIPGRGLVKIRPDPKTGRFYVDFITGERV